VLFRSTDLSKGKNGLGPGRKVTCCCQLKFAKPQAAALAANPTGTPLESVGVNVAFMVIRFSSRLKGPDTNGFTSFGFTLQAANGARWTLMDIAKLNGPPGGDCVSWKSVASEAARSICCCLCTLKVPVKEGIDRCKVPAKTPRPQESPAPSCARTNELLRRSWRRGRKRTCGKCAIETASEMITKVSAETTLQHDGLT